MGEYARYHGEEIKIGTCEDMYYLRFDQRLQVQPLRGNVDPFADGDALRWRFPWPNEDHVKPGAFEDYHKGVVPMASRRRKDVEHIVDAAILTIREERAEP